MAVATELNAARAILAAAENSLLPVPGSFVDLEGRIDTFLHRPAAPFTAAEVGQQIVHLVRCAEKLKLEAARLTGIFAETGEAENQGSNDVIDWVRHHARTSAGEALALRSVGAQVANLPASVEALGKGEIGFGHLRNMSYNAAFSEKSGSFDEMPLLELAKVESVSRFRRTARSYRHIQDAQRVVEEEVAAVEFRNLTFNQTDDGRCFVNVELDPAGFLTAMTAIDGRSDRFGRDDHRLKARRRADGFVEMCRDDMERGAKPADSLPPVHIVINTSLETFQGRPGAPAAETEYDVMLSGAAVGRLSCAAAITGILMDGKLLPVGVSKLKRRLSKREMRALRQMYPRCVRPGCRRPSSQCEAHHITWWSLGGKTQIEDMCMLCPFHHWQLHEGGWQMARQGDGSFVWIPPQFARGPTAAITA